MKKKILIVEDEHALGAVLQQRLNDEGYETMWEVDGELGLQRMRESKPDLVLLDIVMPKKDGYEVLEEKANDSSIKDIPVIIISNSGQPVEIKHIIELGAKDYIIKANFSPDEVLHKVHKYLEPHETSEHSMEGKTGASILVVEDDSFLSSLSVEKFSKLGYKVSSVPDGEQALKFLARKKPDLILLDIMMPGIDGFEVLRSVRADDRLKQVAVVIFSNLGQDQDVEEARRLGADDFLIKAKFTLSEVAERIETVLKKKRNKKVTQE